MNAPRVAWHEQDSADADDRSKERCNNTEFATYADLDNETKILIAVIGHRSRAFHDKELQNSIWRAKRDYSPTRDLRTTNLEPTAAVGGLPSPAHSEYGYQPPHSHVYTHPSQISAVIAPSSPYGIHPQARPTKSYRLPLERSNITTRSKVSAQTIFLELDDSSRHPRTTSFKSTPACKPSGSSRGIPRCSS